MRKAVISFVSNARPKNNPARRECATTWRSSLSSPGTATSLEMAQNPASTQHIADVSSIFKLLNRVTNGSRLKSKAAPKAGARPAARRTIKKTNTHDTAANTATR